MGGFNSIGCRHVSWTRRGRQGRFFPSIGQVRSHFKIVSLFAVSAIFMHALAGFSSSQQSIQPFRGSAPAGGLLPGSYDLIRPALFPPLFSLSPFSSFYANFDLFPSSWLNNQIYKPDTTIIRSDFASQRIHNALFDSAYATRKATFSPVAFNIFPSVSQTFPLVNPVSFSVNPASYGFPSIFNPFASFFTGVQPSPLALINGGLFNGRRIEVVVPPLDAIPVYTYQVMNIYPHDRTAFTQGLVFENGFLYEGTGIPGLSTLRRVDLETGNVLQSIDLAPQYFGEGVTIFGNRIIQLTWLHNIGFVYDKYTFELLQEFSYPTEGWGITHDGKNLIMSDGTSTLHVLDPVTFAEVGLINVYDAAGPVVYLNELEFIQGEIYANVWLTDRIARIDPVSGQVVGWIDLTGLLDTVNPVYPADVLNGIAYDAAYDRLFVTGKFWPALFEIDLVLLF
ncbi:MAG: glutaminyl-peptide cyclotransferase [bacterium]